MKDSTSPMKAFANDSSAFGSSRSNVSGLHFGPTASWINDPAGLVYYRGVYHLFYQTNPSGTEWGNIHWGHATSTNLLQWYDHGVAISPHPVLGMPFTGSIVLDSENSSGLFPESSAGFVAFLTTAKRVPGEDNLLQTQSIAYSHDEGRTWRWYPGNPVIENDGLRDFRDPKVIYHHETSRWIACISAGDCIRFYWSKNLIEWNRASTYALPYVPDVCECPNLVRFPDGPYNRWALVYSLAHPTDARFSGVRYVTGRFDGEQFHPDFRQERRLDDGPDFYAVQFWHGLPSGSSPIAVAWANNSAYAHRLASHPRKVTGMLTIPRRISIAVSPEEPYPEERSGDPALLRQEPVSTYQAYFPPRSTPAVHEDGHISFDQVQLAFPFQLTLRNRADGSDSIRIRIEWLHEQPEQAGAGSTAAGSTPPSSGAAGARLVPLLDFTYDGPSGHLHLARTAADSESPGQLDYSRRVPLPDSGHQLELKLLLEDGIAEVFAFDGLVAATFQLEGVTGPLRIRIDYDQDASVPEVEGYTIVPEDQGEAWPDAAVANDAPATTGSRSTETERQYGPSGRQKTTSTTKHPSRPGKTKPEKGKGGDMPR